MAKLAGKDGICTIDNVTLDVTGWSYTGTVDLGETTGVGDDYKEFIPTMRSGSGSLTFILDPTDATQKTLIQQIQTGITEKRIDCKLEYDDANNKRLHFSAWVASVDLPEAANGVVQGTINFTQDGVTYATPTAT